MSRRRKIGLISSAAGLALVVDGWHEAPEIVLAGTGILLLASTEAAAFALSFFFCSCLSRLCSGFPPRMIDGLELNSARHQAVADWQLFWSLELPGLVIGLVGFTLNYIRGEERRIAA